jgi:hypothetical protein
MSKFVAAVILVCLAGCGAPGPPTAETAGTSAGGDGAGGADAGAGQADPNCGVSAKGVVVCPDPRTRLAEWDTYAVHEDGQTLDLHFVGPGADCAKIDDVSPSVMPTEVHVTLRLLDLKRGCDQAHRTATVTLSEPLAGRPVYSEISVAGGGVSSRGYTGAVEGPECLGPAPAPRAQVNRCPQPTNEPPPPLQTTPDPHVRGGRDVSWASATLRDDQRHIELQWVSTKCARFGGVTVEQRRTAVVLTLRELTCEGAAVARGTTVNLGRPLGDRRVIDGTYAMP